MNTVRTHARSALPARPRAAPVFLGAAWLLAGLLLQAPPAAGQAVASFDRWTREDGLTQNAVFALAEDPQGFLWIATERGLDRFDGHLFEHVRTDGTAIAGLPHDFVWALANGRDALWIGTNGGGLARFRPELQRVESWPQLAREPTRRSIMAVLEASNGTVWAGTRGGGLLRLDPNRLQPDGDATAAATFYTRREGLPDDDVRCLAETIDGSLWAGTPAGIAVLGQAASRFVPLPAAPVGDASPIEVVALVADDEGGAWAGTANHGLWHLDRSGRPRAVLRHRADDPTSLPSDTVFSLARGPGGTLWAGTDRGLARIHVATGRSDRYAARSDDPEGLPGNQVIALQVARDGAVWVGTFSNGVARLDPSRAVFGTVRPRLDAPERLSPYAVRALLEDAAGTLWIGTFGGGLHRLRRDGEVDWWRAASGELPQNNVWVLHEDRNGHVWIGTDLGLLRVAPGGEPTGGTRPEPMLAGPSGTLLRALAEDGAGMLWVGGTNGLVRLPLAGGAAQPVLLPSSGEPLAEVYALALDTPTRAWVGTWTGLCWLDLDARTSHCYAPDTTPPLPDALVWALHRDRHGRLWVGTNRGLLRVDEAAAGGARGFQRIGVADGLPSDVVYAIVEDDDGALWLSTNSGLARYDPTDGAVRVFDRRDGLVSDELSFGGAFRARDGSLYVGGQDGYSHFRPRAVLAQSRAAPRVVLVELRLDDQPVAVDPPRPQRRVLHRALDRTERLQLSWRDRRVAFRFTAPEFRAPGRLRFEYRLDGFDPDWRLAGEERIGTYTNLEPGAYQLRVRVRGADGQVSPHQATLAIEVATPWWNATWFRAVLTLALLAGLAAIHRLRIRALEARRGELERLVAERTEDLEAKTLELEEKNQELYQASVRDRLTGAYNRAFGADALTRAVADARRHGRPFAVVLADLDHFKQVNDQHGHAAGDAVLRHAVERVAARLRRGDILVRWGGEELLVLLANTPLAGAANLAETLRAGLAAEPVGWEDRGIPITASFGVAELAAASTETPEAMLHRADLALYRAKQGGRNRVERG